MNVNSDNILMERSAAGIKRNPPINDIGIPNETQKASLGFKKMANTKTTKVRPRYAFLVRRSILPFKRTDSSLKVPISTPSGSVGAVFSTYDFIELATSKAL